MISWRSTVLGAQNWFKDALKAGGRDALAALVEDNPYAWTAQDKASGKLLAVCGILADGKCWAVLSPDLAPRIGQIRTVTSAVRDVLATFTEIEGFPPSATVQPLDKAAQRWAGALGMLPTDDGDNTWEFKV